MHTRTALRVAGLLLLLGTLGCGDSDCGCPGRAYPETIAAGRSVVQEVMSETRATAVSVALVEGERLVWSEAFGDADRSSGRKANTDSLFAACSVSKMLASAAVMILVDQGKVSLDEPVVTYLPDFSMPLDPRHRDITVRMLLNHSSGLPGSDLRGAITVTPFPGYAAQMMAGLASQRLKHDPGVESTYNNDGFTMLENLIHRVSGQAYPDFVREQILDPLGMRASRFNRAPLPMELLARPHEGGTPRTLYSYNVYATGGLFTTPEDLARLATLLLQRGTYGAKRLLSTRAVDTMAQDQRLGAFNPVPFDEFRYGLGWDTVAQPGLAAAGATAWQKTGDMDGYYGANLMVLPEAGLGVVVFGASNGFSSASAVKISERILLRALVERGRIPRMPEPLATTPRSLAALPAGERARYEGIYASGSGAYRLRFGADDAIALDEYREDWTPKYEGFRLRDEGWYAADGDPHTALRLLNRAGHDYVALRLKRGLGHYTIATMFAQKLEPRPALSDAWQARVAGRWLPVNADPWYFLLVKGDTGTGFRTIPEMPGYLCGSKVFREMDPASENRLDGMFMKLPDGARDLQDAAIEVREGQDWLRLGSTLHRPLDGLAELPVGASTVAIGSEGLAEWRRLPATGSLTLSGATYWFLYDADWRELASGSGSGAPSFSGTGSKHLVLFGGAGTPIAATLTLP